MPKIINAAMPAPTAPPPEPEWEERTLVFRLSGGRIHTEDGWRFSELFVHASLPNDGADLVNVTHVATRLAILRVREVEDAIAGAEILWNECRGAWQYADEIDKTKIPSRVEAWIRECNNQKKLVPLCPP